MTTAEQVRREWWAGYWRIRESQLRLQEEYFVPLGKLVGEKLREAYSVDTCGQPPQN